jgi:cytochrome P450
MRALRDYFAAIVDARRSDPQGDLISALVAAEEAGDRLSLGELLSTLVLLLAGANRDPSAFADPDRLDLGRRDVRHLAFSQGIHFCLGAQLARLEASLALGALVTRLPGLRLADASIRWSSNTVLRGPEALQLVW